MAQKNEKEGKLSNAPVSIYHRVIIPDCASVDKNIVDDKQA